jgi:hypothetical protein
MKLPISACTSRLGATDRKRTDEPEYLTLCIISIRLLNYLEGGSNGREGEDAGNAERSGMRGRGLGGGGGGGAAGAGGGARGGAGAGRSSSVVGLGKVSSASPVLGDSVVVDEDEVGALVEAAVTLVKGQLRVCHRARLHGHLHHGTR